MKIQTDFYLKDIDNKRLVSRFNDDMSLSEKTVTLENYNYDAEIVFHLKERHLSSGVSLDDLSDRDAEQIVKDILTDGQSEPDEED